MAIEFDRTDGEFVSSAGGAMPTYEAFTATAIMRPDYNGADFGGCICLEKSGATVGVTAVFKNLMLELYDYTGTLICQLGPMVLGGYYGIAIVSEGGKTTPGGARLYLKRLDVAGSISLDSGAWSTAFYTGAVEVLRYGDTAYLEAMDGSLQNCQVHNVALTTEQIEAAWLERAPFAAVMPQRWFNMGGPDLTAALVDEMGGGNLGITGSLAYSAGFTLPAATYSETLNDSVTLVDSWEDQLEAAPHPHEYPNETISLTDSMASTAVMRESMAETVTLTDSWLVSVLSGSGLGACFYSGGAGNAAPAVSIGGPKSSSELRRRLFARATKADHEARLVRNRLIYVSAAATVELKLYVSQQPQNARIEIAWAAAAKNVEEPAVADEFAAPPGVVFSAPASEAEAISAGVLNEGDWRGLWIREILLDVQDPTASDPFTITATGV